MKKAPLLTAVLAAATANAGPSEIRNLRRDLHLARSKPAIEHFITGSEEAGRRRFFFRLWRYRRDVVGPCSGARNDARGHRSGPPGLGNSRPEDPSAQYDMASVARSNHSLMQKLKMRREAIMGHDIGLIVAYSYAAQFRSDVTNLALMD